METIISTIQHFITTQPTWVIVALTTVGPALLWLLKVSTDSLDKLH